MLACKQTPASPGEVQPSSSMWKWWRWAAQQLRIASLKTEQSSFAGHLLLVFPSLYRHCLLCLHRFVSAKQMIYSYKQLFGLESGSSAVWMCLFTWFLAPQLAVSFSSSSCLHDPWAIFSYFLFFFFLAVAMVVHLIKSNITKCPVLAECWYGEIYIYFFFLFKEEWWRNLISTGPLFPCQII